MKVYNREYRIKSFDVDLNKKLKLSRLFHLFQESAYRHASILNFGYQDLKEKNQFWVLARVRVEFLQFPRWDDKIKIVTWHKGARRLFALRDFQIVDSDGNILINASSSWLVVNLDSKRPVRINKIMNNAKSKRTVNALQSELNKIHIPDSIKQINTINVRYSDIDLNNHVNNAKYLEWMMNNINIEIIQANKIKSLDVNFLKETVYNDQVDIYQYREDKQIYSLFRNGSKDVFRGKLTFQ